MMLIKLFLFFLLLLILPDMYIYKAYIRRVSQKWTHWAYWLPSLFLLLGMTLVFSIHEPRPDSMQRLSNFLLIFLCFSVPKALFVIVILFMKLLYIISGKKLYGGYVAGGLALASLIYVIYGATEGNSIFKSGRKPSVPMNFPAALTATALYKYLISIPAAGLATVLLYRRL